MHYLYILYSKSIDRHYIGESPNPGVRLERHNGHHFKKAFTKAADDWNMVLSKNANQSGTRSIWKSLSKG